MHMELIKENKEKKRAVFSLNDSTVRKYWYENSIDWVTDHVKILETVVPEYVIGYGLDQRGVFADFKKLSGIPASTIPHTEEFIKQIYNFCLENIQSTQPYVHGDWVLSNIIVDGDIMSMCDWDNLNIYPKEETIKKLHSDLRSAFGKKFDEVVQ